MRPTLFLTVGLPGTGKTTAARRIEVDYGALRLTKDEWVRPLYGSENPPAAQDVIEGRLVQVGLRALELGVDVVLDFGLWSRDERSALRWIAHARGIPVRVVYLPIDYEEQRRRVSDRARNEPGQFHLSDAELAQWHGRLEVPEEEELRGDHIPPPPTGCATWAQWASERWPSLPDG